MVKTFTQNPRAIPGLIPFWKNRRVMPPFAGRTKGWSLESLMVVSARPPVTV